jgi:hypothetical protein
MAAPRTHVAARFTLRRRPWRRVLAAGFAALLAGACGQDAAVDSALVGTWQIDVPDGRWTLTVDAAGHYAFVNGSSGAAPSHEGELVAQAGTWSLHSTAPPGIDDRGTYTMLGDGLQLAGNLSSLRWERGTPAGAAAAPVAAPAAVTATRAVATPAAPSVPTQAAAIGDPANTLGSVARNRNPTPEIIDPCLLVTAEEASALLGSAVNTQRKTPQPVTQNDCRYRVGSDNNRSVAITSYNGGGVDVAGYLEQRRGSGGEDLAGIGDGAVLTYREATGLTTLNFVFGRATIEILVAGVARERAQPEIVTLAQRASMRIATEEAAYSVPGLARFVGTWMVTSRSDAAFPRMMLSIEKSGALRLLSALSFSGALVVGGGNWRVEDGVNPKPPSGTYSLTGNRLNFGGDVLKAELARIACRESAKVVQPPFEFTRDLAGMLNGQGLMRLRGQPAGAGPFDVKLAGLWEGTGTTGVFSVQVLAAIDRQGHALFALFPLASGRLKAERGLYEMSIETFGDSSGPYRFRGGTDEGSIEMQDGNQTLLWTPYDASYHPPYEVPIVGHCN